MLKMKTSSLSEQSDKRWKIKVVTVGHMSAKSHEKKETEKMVKSSSKQVRTEWLICEARDGIEVRVHIIEKCPYYRGVSKKRFNRLYLLITPWQNILFPVDVTRSLNLTYPFNPKSETAFCDKSRCLTLGQWDRILNAYKKKLKWKHWNVLEILQLHKRACFLYYWWCYGTCSNDEWPGIFPALSTVW